jgi:hypothetical protein
MGMGTIPLDIANQILAVFGITEPTAMYGRRVSTGGFMVKGFADVLYESRFVFVIDRSVELDVMCAEIATGLAELGAPVDVETDEEDGTTGAVTSPHAATVIRFNGAAGDGYAAVEAIIRAFQHAAGDTVEFRGRPRDARGDCWIYAVLTPDEWRTLDGLHNGVIRRLFAPLPS